MKHIKPISELEPRDLDDILGDEKINPTPEEQEPVLIKKGVVYVGRLPKTFNAIKEDVK